MTEVNLQNEHFPAPAQKLRELFTENIGKRICVVGPSCVGKSTMLSYLPEAIDMDDLLFGSKEKGLTPLLTPQEIEYVCGPWTPEVGQFMKKRAVELIQIKAGRPVFGTIVFPSDLVIEITLPDELLRQRIQQRGGNENDVFNMKKQIEAEIEQSGAPKIVLQNN